MKKSFIASGNDLSLRTERVMGISVLGLSPFYMTQANSADPDQTLH